MSAPPQLPSSPGVNPVERSRFQGLEGICAVVFLVILHGRKSLLRNVLFEKSNPMQYVGGPCEVSANDHTLWKRGNKYVAHASISVARQHVGKSPAERPLLPSCCVPGSSYQHPLHSLPVHTKRTTCESWRERRKSQTLYRRMFLLTVFPMMKRP